MRSKEDIQERVMAILTELREKKGFSKTRMAEYLGVDKHTWIRWESGANMPSIVDMIMIYDKLGESIIGPILDMLYPTETASVMPDAVPVAQVRKEVAKYFLEGSSDHMVRVWNFLHHGLHGSEIQYQVEEFCAIDHLPMQYRYFIAQQVYVYYMMARQRKELISTDEVMPDMDVWSSGMKRSQKAAFDRLQSYREDPDAKL